MTAPPQGFPHGLPPVKPQDEALAAGRRLLEARAPLAHRIAWVAAQVARLPKTQQAPTGGGGTFRYTPVEDMAAAVTALCAAAGVAMLPEVVDPLSEGPDWRHPDPENTRTRWRYLYRITWCITDGVEERRVQTMGEAMDWGDKGSNKAMTAARKYLYLMLFHLQTGDDPDAHRPELPPAEAGNRPAQQQRRQAARQQRRRQEPQGGTQQARATQETPLGRRRFQAVLNVHAGEVPATLEALRRLEVERLTQLQDQEVWRIVAAAAGIALDDELPEDPGADLRSRIAAAVEAEKASTGSAG